MDVKRKYSRRVATQRAVGRKKMFQQMAQKVSEAAHKKNDCDFALGTLTTNEKGKAIKIEPMNMDNLNKTNKTLEETDVEVDHAITTKKMTFQSRFAAGIMIIIRRMLTKSKED